MVDDARTERREKDGVRSKDAKLSVPTAEISSTTTETYCCSLLATMS